MSYVITQDPRTDAVPELSDLDYERVIDVMARLAGARPWTSLSVNAICAEAGVSRAAFDRRFKSVEACFAAAAEDALTRLYATVADRTDETDGTWPDRVCALVAGFLGFLVADRERAWIAVAEPLGGRARVARKHTVKRLVALAGEAPPDARGEDRAIAATIETRFAGLWELGRQHLADTGAQPIEDVARSTVFLMLSPYLSRDEAMRYAFTTTVDVPSGGDAPLAGATAGMVADGPGGEG